MEDKNYISWDTVQKASNYIVESCKCKDYQYIIGIARGGLIPATLIAYKLDLPLYVIGVNTYDHTDGEDIKVRQNMYIPEDAERILIVDDISDTGNTLDYTHQLYNELEFTKIVDTATITMKSHTTHIPTYVYESNDKWAVFPWDM